MEPNLLEVSFHWPHNRFAFGFQTFEAKDEWDYFTLEIFIGIMTITYNNV